MASKSSIFYVESPAKRDAAQRHSMFVSQSELGPRDASSSASTLPTVSGSMDRLTKLGEKKPKFFTLRPKTSFSLRPFFSASPSSKRRKSAEVLTLRRDSGVQTDRRVDEVGVQTASAPTVDVPVQTSFAEWADDKLSACRRRFSTPILPLTFSSVASSSPADRRWFPKSAPSEEYPPPKSSDASDPGSKTTNSGSVDKPAASSVPVRYFSAKELISGFVSRPLPSSNRAEVESNKKFDESSSPEHSQLPDTITTRREDGKNQPGTSNLPSLEASSSPQSKSKNVHFFDATPDANIRPADKPIKIEKEFESLLRNLNIVSDGEEERDLDLSLNACVVENRLPQDFRSPKLKSAFEVLRQDFFLETIPENGQEAPLDKSGKNQQHVGTLEKPDVERTQSSDVIVDHHEVRSENATSAQSYLNEVNCFIPGNGGNFGNEEVNKHPASFASMPTLPSFFEATGKCGSLTSPTQTTSVLPPPPETVKSPVDSREPDISLDMPSETKSNFDSCENLDQLEEEIIRSLCDPVNQETMPVLHPQESTVKTGIDTTIRPIVDDQPGGTKGNNTLVFDKKPLSPSKSRSPVKPAKKYTATLIRMEGDAVSKSIPTNYNKLIVDSALHDLNTQSGPTNNETKIGEVCLLRCVSPVSPDVAIHNLPSVSASTPSNESVPTVDTKQSERCDFTNCLKPSQMRNSPFMTEISSLSMTPRPGSDTPMSQPCPPKSATPSSNGHQGGRKLTPSELGAGKCDFASCLKPSQVRNNTPFGTELSELTASKYGSYRYESPPTVHRNQTPDHLKSPTNPDRISDGEVGPNDEDATKSQTGSKQPNIVKSEARIVLQTPQNLRTGVEPSPPPPPPPPLPPPWLLRERSNISDAKEPKLLSELENFPKNKNQETDIFNNEVTNERKINENEDPPVIIARNKIQNGYNGNVSEKRETQTVNIKIQSNLQNDILSSKTIITDEPPPPGAVLIDKKVTVDGDKVHTDKAIPVKEVLKEKTSTTKFIPAPPKYEGIGPTEEGIPTGLRNSVKKENMHNWYKTMFKSLHKADLADDMQEYIVGYSSDPETNKKEPILRKKSSTLDNRPRDSSPLYNNNTKQSYPPSAKSSIEVYNVRPRLIEDYEPGYSSLTDNENITMSKRFLPTMNIPKPSYEYKNGYESDTNIVKKATQPEGLDTEQQKHWYREIQRGGDIPQFGLSKPAPEKPKEPTIGPLPPPPLHYPKQPNCQQAVRPTTLPPDYTQQTNGVCQQMNGVYEIQMRNAIHNEMQQRLSPYPQPLSPNRSNMKSPCKSPDLRIPAQALFDFKPESPKELPLKKSDMVLILRQLDKNWYEGEHHGKIGIFPISYVEIVPPEHVSPIKLQLEGLGKALYDFQAQSNIELSVRKGDTLQLLRRVDGNWYEGKINNKKGIVPVSYIQVIQEPSENSLGSPSMKSYSSSPRSSSEYRDKSQRTFSNPSSPRSANTSSPQSMVNENAKIQASYKKSGNLITPVLYRANYGYTPQNSDELELQEGDMVYVVEICDDGWFVGKSVRTGIFGIFPGNYVEKV